MRVDNMDVVVALILVELALLFAPLGKYLLVGWRQKRSDIMDGLNESAREAYFEMFCHNFPATARLGGPEKICADFEDLYSKWYGRRHFVFPGVLLLAVSAFAACAFTLSVFGNLHFVRNPFVRIPASMLAALAGAYLWVVNDLISRARRLDLSPSDLYWEALRLLIAIPMGSAFSAVAAPAIGPFIAFALGAFPLQSLTSIMRRLTERGLNIQSSGAESGDDIIKLQGINPTIVERLNNEDISTVVQLAYCDPVHLTMRSNLSFNFVTDCMNQALAWMYLESRLALLRPLGMRGAIEIRQLIWAYDRAGETDDEKRDHALAVAAFPKIAAAIGIDGDALQQSFRQIADDPFTHFLEKIWT